MEVTGTIIKLNKNITLVSSSCNSCSTCASKDSCAMNMGADKIIEVLNPIQAEIGEKVLINIPPSRVISAATIIYILPLIIMFCGYFIGVQIMKNETGGVIGCLFGLLSGFGLSFLIDRFFKGRNLPTIKRILEADDELLMRQS